MMQIQTRLSSSYNLGVDYLGNKNFRVNAGADPISFANRTHKADITKVTSSNDHIFIGLSDQSLAVLTPRNQEYILQLGYDIVDLNVHEINENSTIVATVD